MCPVTRVLLVTGARSLAASPDAERWARALIASALAGVDLLIVGDAPGPDAWARDAMRARCHQYVAFGPHAGSVYAWADGAAVWEGDVRWGPSRRQVQPLRRNAAMVADCKRLAAEGATVSVLALLDGTKRDAPGRRATRGTEHTVGLAERAGLIVRREVWRP